MMGVFLMSKRSPISLQLKLHAVQWCLKHQSSLNYEAKKLPVKEVTVKDWITKYEAEGLDGLKESTIWKHTLRNWRLLLFVMSCLLIALYQQQ